jgi:UDP-2,3-diacylglucosamine hydrolase
VAHDQSSPITHQTIPGGKKIYFLSDFHLGAPNPEASREREQRIVRFLNEARQDAAQIFIVGDMFDFWYEYKRVVPKGFVRLLGTLAQISDSSIPITFFTGNHDMWMKGYFEKELNIAVYHEPQVFVFNDKKFYIGHGDGLGPGDHGYKFIKKVFRNPVCRFLFGALHPRLGIALADYFSRKSREATGSVEEKFLGEDKEWLVQYCKDILAKEDFDFFIFGHRHLPIDFAFPSGARYINLGDWIRYFTYAEFDGQTVTLLYNKA